MRGVCTSSGGVMSRSQHPPPAAAHRAGLTAFPRRPILHLVVKYQLDAVATAVASAPRRSIIERLGEGDASMSDLADLLEVTLPAVDKHLRVLLDAGVVTKEKAGRTTSVRL